MRKTTNPYYQGPKSDHFDGLHFFLPRFRVRNCTNDFMKWQRSGERAAWPKRVENKPFPSPATRTRAGELSVTFIGHATVLLQIDGINILTDPFLSDRTSPVQWAGPRRVRDPGIAIEDLPPIDVILVSHNHYDHMDLPSLRRLHDRHGARIVTPLGNGAIIRKARRPFHIVEGDWGDRFSLAKDIDVTLTPAMHWSKRTLNDRNMALWSAFVIEAPGGPVYFAADTGYRSGGHFHEVFRDFGPPRLALLPIGAYEPRWFMSAQHMNPEEAVLAHQHLQAHRSVAIHHGTVQLTDEAIDQPIVDHQRAMEHHDVEAESFRVLEAGESWSIPPLATTRQTVLEPAAE